MAVYAAHLTRTLSSAPSIFEVTAQEQLAATVRPALRKLAEFIAALHPGRLSWLLRWYDELYLLLNGVLQYHYLKHYAASFAECFYGLRRVARAPGEFADGRRLPAAAERLSLLTLVLLPYARSKLEEAAERWRRRDHDGLLGESWRERGMRAAARAHAAAHCAYEALCCGAALAYALGGGGAPSPTLRLAGVVLERAPPAAPDTGHTWRQLWADLGGGNFRQASVTFDMVGTAVLRGMEVGAFSVQFLRWWASRDAAAAPALPVPPPPHPPQDDKPARYRNRCPICLQHWRIPTALPVSGYIYCYRCISRELRDGGACPVTRYPAREQDLVRMYLDP